MLILTSLLITAAGGLLLAGCHLKGAFNDTVKILWGIFFFSVFYSAFTAALLFTSETPQAVFWAYTFAKFLLLLQAPLLFVLLRINRQGNNESQSQAFPNVAWHLGSTGAFALVFFMGFILTFHYEPTLSRQALIKAAFANVFYGQFHQLSIAIASIYCGVTAYLAFFCRQASHALKSAQQRRANSFLHTAIIVTSLAWGLLALKIILWWGFKMLTQQGLPPLAQWHIGNLHTGTVCLGVLALLVIKLKGVNTIGANQDVNQDTKGESTLENHTTENSTIWGSAIKENPAAGNSSSSLAPPITNPYYAQRITQALDKDKIYLKPNLTIGALSEHTGIDQADLSESLKAHFKSSFSEQVNGYRIMQAKKLLSKKGAIGSIEEVMRHSGFNSRTAFNRAFKTQTGMSPSEYRASHNSEHHEKEDFCRQGVQ